MKNTFWRRIVLDWRMPIADIMCQYSAYLTDSEKYGKLNWIKTNANEILMLETVKQMRTVSSRFSIPTSIIILFFRLGLLTTQIYLQKHNTSGFIRVRMMMFWFYFHHCCWCLQSTNLYQGRNRHSNAWDYNKRRTKELYSNKLISLHWLY